MARPFVEHRHFDQFGDVMLELRRRLGFMEILESEPGKQLAGFYDCIEKLWGAPIMTELGLTLLPSLKEGYIWAEGADLDRLENEAQTILQNLVIVAQKTDWRDDFIRVRTENILDAIQRAKDVHGGVVIW